MKTKALVLLFSLLIATSVSAAELTVYATASLTDTLKEIDTFKAALNEHFICFDPADVGVVVDTFHLWWEPGVRPFKLDRPLRNLEAWLQSA